MTSLLIVPDAHARPGVSNRRFDWLGQYVAETRPDIIMQMGDWWDFPSLSSYDKGKACFEGRRFKADVEAGLEAHGVLDLRLRPLKRRYSPRKVQLLGNHEERISRLVQATPELEGTISYECLRYKGWEQHGYLEAIDVEGFLFSHYFTSGVMGRPIGGESHARTLLLKQHQSCVQGHSHLWDFKELTRADGTKMQAFVTGCFIDPEQVEAYAGPAQKLWWSGLTLLKGAEGGHAGSFERVSTADLQRRYG